MRKKSNSLADEKKKALANNRGFLFYNLLITNNMHTRKRKPILKQPAGLVWSKTLGFTSKNDNFRVADFDTASAEDILELCSTLYSLMMGAMRDKIEEKIGESLQFVPLRHENLRTTYEKINLNPHICSREDVLDILRVRKI